MDKNMAAEEGGKSNVEASEAKEDNVEWDWNSNCYGDYRLSSTLQGVSHFQYLLFH